MLSTEFAQIGLISAAVLASLGAVAAFFYVRKASAYVKKIADWAVSDWQRAIHETKVGDLEQRVTEIEDTQASHGASIARLRSKYAMRDMRAKKKDQASSSEDAPNGAESDEADYFAKKTALRMRAKKMGFLK